MLRKITLLWMLVLLTITTQAQDIYVVQQIKGQIKRGSTNIKRGDRIKSVERIAFAKGAVMMVSSQKYGKMVLSSKAPQIHSETAYTLAELLPKSKKASTKANMIIASDLDWQSYFGIKEFRIYGQKAEIDIAENYQKLDDKHFYFFQYRHPSEAKPVSKKLTPKAKTLIISKTELFKISGKAVYPKDCKDFKLYFYDKNLEAFPQVASFTPVFVNDSEMLVYAQEKIAILGKQLDRETYQTFYAQLQDFATAKYGATEKDNLKEWIEKKLGVSIID